MYGKYSLISYLSLSIDILNMPKKHTYSATEGPGHYPVSLETVRTLFVKTELPCSIQMPWQQVLKL